jgi:ribonuclease J
LCEDGAVVELLDGEARIADEPVPAGQVYVDGLLSDVGPAVLRDRGRLADEGVCVAVVTIDPHKGEVVETPLVIQKGVVFADDTENLLDAATKALDVELASMKKARFADQEAVQRHVVQTLSRFWKAETGRRPVILPVVLEA